MDKPAYKRGAYTEVLKQRAREVIERFNEAEFGKPGAEEYEYESAILDALTETAKESFKAGIEVGRKKTGQPSQRPKRA